MRILRLSTEDNEGIFDNNFQSDIIVKPYSKIALANIAFEIQEEEVIIESGNDTIQYLVTGTEPASLKTITLDHGTYNKSNINTLLNEIKKKMNNSLTTNGKEIGMEWNVELNKSNKVEFEFRIGKLQDYPDDFNLFDVERLASGIYRRITTGGVSSDVYRMYLDKYLSRGCGVFRCRLNNLTAGAGTDDENGIIFGLTTSNPDTLLNKQIVESDIKIGIKATKLTNSYAYNTDGGSFSASTVNPNIVGTGSSSNDTLQVAIEGDKLVARIFQNGGSATGEKLVEVAYDNEADVLYPFITFRGGKDQVSVRNVRLTESQFQPSPYKLYHLDTLDHDLDAEHLGADAPQPPPTATGNTLLRFEGDSLADFLGYNNLRNPRVGYIVSNYHHSFIGDNTVDLPTANELFIIELLNIKLNSYDGLSEERRSIIATIPKKNENTIVQYEPYQKVFIDIGNHDALTIRNLQAVIRQNDLAFQPTKGLSSMTLLIKDSDE